MPTNVFTAKLPGTCSICGKEIQGTRVSRDSKTQKLAHADCIWPDRKDQPKQAPQQQQAPSQPQALREHPINDKWIEENLDHACDLIARKLAVNPNLADVAQGTIAEIMHERWASKTTERIQRGRQQ